MNLAAGTTATLSLEFDPPSEGFFQGSLTISSDDPDPMDQEIEVILVGTNEVEIGRAHV